MESNGTTQTLLIGTGGLNPGLWIIRSDNLSAESLLHFPSSHSVYALYIDAEGKRFAIGDRAGNIHVYSWPGMSTAAVPEKLFHLIQGAPVLSVCLTGESMLASSDTLGRCLLWHPMEDKDHPAFLEGDGFPICSISRLDEDRIAGLSAGGSLLIWDTHRKILSESLAGPRPLRKLGFVKLVHWPNHDAVVYPTEEGLLASVTLSTLSLQIHEAHSGPLSACIADGEKLYTLGELDGRMKTWTWGATGCTLVRSGSAPKGIVSGEPLDDMPRKLLLINSEGEAAVYSFDDASLHVIHRLEGNHYRVATGPTASVRRAMGKRRRTALCQTLRAEALERIDNGKTEGLEDLYRQITESGFELVVVGLRAHQAFMQNDIIEELRARHRLIEIIPDLDRKSLHRYAFLLVTTWCIPEAKKILDQIQEDDPSNSNWLNKTAKALGGKAWVIESDHPIPFLIEAATILDRPFSGRWVVETSPPIPFPDESLEAETLGTQFEQVIATDHLENLPRADTQSTWWISEGSVRKVDVVVFADPTNRNKAGFRWAIQIVKDGMSCNIVPTVLFDTGPKPMGWSAGEHNRSMLSLYEKGTGQDGAISWPRKLIQAVTHTIRRLRTCARSRRQWKRN